METRTVKSVTVTSFNESNKVLWMTLFCKIELCVSKDKFYQKSIQNPPTITHLLIMPVINLRHVRPS